MIAKDQLVNVEILQGGIWVPAQFGQIERGDVFRMSNPDGTLRLLKGESEFVAHARPYVVSDLRSEYNGKIPLHVRIAEWIHRKLTNRG